MAAEGARAAVAPRPPALLSLPNETLAKLFALLSARPGVAFCHWSPDARALAAAHPRLYRLFRHELATRLEFNVKLVTRSGTPVNSMRRLLRRYTRVTAVALIAYGTTGASRRFHEVVACAASRLTVVDLYFVPDLCGSDVSALLARCRGLDELRIVDCRSDLGLDDRDLVQIVEAAGPRLRVLSLDRSVEQVTDVGGARLRDLTALTDLDLGGCPCLGAATFHAITALPVLASLDLGGASFYDKDEAAAALRAALPRMPALRKLDVSWCNAVGPWLWAALPPTLRVLHASCTSLLDQKSGDTCAASLVELRVGHTTLHEDHTTDRRVDWAALTGSHTRALRVLSLTESDMCDLDDASADAALQGMPHLESLDIRYSKNVGDGIASAVARHPALRLVDFRGTSIGPTGVHALRRWEEDGRPAAVRGEPTTAGMFPCKRRASIANRRALIDAL